MMSEPRPSSVRASIDTGTRGPSEQTPAQSRHIHTCTVFTHILFFALLHRRKEIYSNM